MKTSKEKLMDMLLSGMHVNKFLFYERTGTVCLAQRILDIKQEEGWFIRSKSVEGKGTLREYWLDKDEIQRLKSKPQTIEKPKDEQTEEPVQKVAETEQKQTIQQGTLGLFCMPEWE